MRGFTYEQSGTAGVLNLEGALTIQQAGDLKDALLRSLSSAEQVSLHLEKVTDIDIAGLQILCSAYRTARAMNKSLILAGGLSDALKKAVDDSGYSCRAGCSSGPGKICPWII